MTGFSIFDHVTGMRDLDRVFAGTSLRSASNYLFNKVPECRRNFRDDAAIGSNWQLAIGN